MGGCCGRGVRAPSRSREACCRRRGRPPQRCSSAWQSTRGSATCCGGPGSAAPPRRALLRRERAGRPCWRPARWLSGAERTWRGLAVHLDLPRPVVDSLEGVGVVDVEDDHHSIAVLVVEREQRAELLLPRRIPQVHAQRLAAAVLEVVAVEAGAEGVGGLFGEGAVEDLEDAGLADVCVGRRVLVSPSRITFGFFFMIISDIQMESRENRSCLAWFCYRTWYPFKTLRSVLLLAVVLGVLFVGLAILQISLYLGTHEAQVIYASHEGCTERANGKQCEAILEVTQDMQPPIAVLYVLQNAYINHRRYIDSVSPDQLAGKAVDFKQASEKCNPFVTNAEMNETVSYTGVPLEGDFVASPCGFTAKLLFNDTFKLFSEGGSQIAINEKGLFPNAYGQFKRAADSESTQWSDPEGDHLMIWMQNTGSITKYKLWGRIEEPLPAGKYNLVADNNFLVGDLRIKKGLLLVNPSSLGSAVYFFPVVFIVMGLICFAFAIFLKVKLPDYDALLKESESK